MTRRIGCWGEEGGREVAEGEGPKGEATVNVGHRACLTIATRTLYFV